MGLQDLKRAWTTFRAHTMTDRAGALTYFGAQAFFPGLLALISVAGLFGGRELVADGTRFVLENGADRATADTLESLLSQVTSASNGTAGVGLALGILLALNGASGAFGAAGRALNVVHAVDEDRGFVRRKITDLATTVAVLILLVLVLVALFSGGAIAEELFGAIGLGSTAETVWAIARWPVAFALAMVTFGVVYAVAPDVDPRRFRWITPGAVFAVLVWLLASALFGIYLKNFSSYGAAYGVFGGIIVLLLWLYLTANVFLFGAELNMAIERRDTAGRGGPPMVTPPPGTAGQGREPVAVAPRAARRPNPEQTSGGPGESASG